MPVGRYLPLLHYLAALAPEQAMATLSFAELEALLGGPLAATARTSAAYWSSRGVADVNWERDGWTARLEHARRAVTFTRWSPTRRRGDRKYTPLVRYLTALPAEQDSITVPLTEIEAIIGAPLPMGATGRGFWRSDARALAPWRQAGWRAALTADRAAVNFTRREP